jgi:hypothetical protein
MSFPARLAPETAKEYAAPGASRPGSPAPRPKK